MKLFYVINGLGPGGAERSLADLLPFYRRAGIDPTVICLRHREHGMEGEVRIGGSELRFLRGGGILGNARELRKLIRRDRPDLVHTTIFEADIVGRLAAAGLGVPVLTSLVNTSYDPVRLKDPNIRPSRLTATRLVDGWTARHLTTHFHAITQAVKDSAVESLGIRASRVTVVERGRERHRLGHPGAQRRAAARAALGLGPGDEVLVTVGRQEFQKGQRHLLEAFAAIAQSRPRLVLLIVGREGHATAELRQVHQESGLGERVRFLGYRSDVAEMLAAADLFVFPSLYEGLGGALIEAMALGLPIVASDIPALREVVEEGNNAMLVPPGDPRALADALRRMLDDPARAATFGERSLRIFEDRFTIERSAERMIRLCHEVAGFPAPHPEPVG
jgi:glycosyltransferase involved in cell wall biosynthesis